MPIRWSHITTFDRTNERVDAPWIAALDDFGDITHLQLKAEGSWLVMGALLPACGPDGIAGLHLKEDRLVLSDCPPGALIGRIGGSSAGIAAATTAPTSPDYESKPFTIGSQCAIALPSKGAFGSLFVGFNSVLRPVQIASLKLIVSGVKLPQPPPATQ
jgi:hypothetical protein